jgi:hypothetical protein
MLFPIFLFLPVVVIEVMEIDTVDIDRVSKASDLLGVDLPDNVDKRRLIVVFDRNYNQALDFVILAGKHVDVDILVAFSHSNRHLPALLFELTGERFCAIRQALGVDVVEREYIDADQMDVVERARQTGFLVQNFDICFNLIAEPQLAEVDISRHLLVVLARIGGRGRRDEHRE